MYAENLLVVVEDEHVVGDTKLVECRARQLTRINANTSLVVGTCRQTPVGALITHDVHALLVFLGVVNMAGILLQLNYVFSFLAPNLHGRLEGAYERTIGQLVEHVR